MGALLLRCIEQHAHQILGALYLVLLFLDSSVNRSVRDDLESIAIYIHCILRRSMAERR